MRDYVGDVSRLEIFDHARLRSTAGIEWSVWVINVEVRNVVLGARSENCLSKRIKPRKLRWLDHVVVA